MEKRHHQVGPIDANLRLALTGAEAGEWWGSAGLVSVPEGVTELVVTFNAIGQTTDSDQAWFKGVRLARFGQ